MRTDSGRVVFVTIGVDPRSALSEAHELASRLEDDIRHQQPRMADVVVHTEPARREDA
jgi:divalent metal cation (Fe/Co/Zn/Cd) transporter